MKYRHLLLSSALAVPAIVFACSYGNYDGSFDAGADGGDGGGDAGGTVVLARPIDPGKTERLNTPDGAFQLTIAAGTFDGTANISITRLADRTIANSLVVPTYGVAADKQPGLPFEVKFTGNNPNPGSQALVPALADPDGTFKPTPMVGTGFSGGGPSSEFWGLARRFGTFSLVFETFSSSSAFVDVTMNSCLATCCATSGSSTNAGAVGESCACAGGPNLECFLRTCVPNVAAAIERCVEIAKIGPQVVSCINSGSVPQCQGGPPTCGYPTTCSSNTGGSGTCCINAHAGYCTGTGGGGGTSGPCPGINIRCDINTPCPDGTKCCVFDNEAYCASACPTERTWCRTQGDCDGGASADGGPDAGPSTAGPCFAARNCPHGTCGAPPTACTN